MLEIKHFQYLWCPTKRVWKWLQNGLKFIFNTTLDSDKCLDSISLRLSIWSCFNLNTNIPYLSTRAYIVYLHSTLFWTFRVDKKWKFSFYFFKLFYPNVTKSAYFSRVRCVRCWTIILWTLTMTWAEWLPARHSEWASTPQHFPIIEESIF